MQPTTRRRSPLATRVRSPSAPLARRSTPPCVRTGQRGLPGRTDVPGFKPEDVEIEIEDDVLTLHGEHQERTEEKAITITPTAA